MRSFTWLYLMPMFFNVSEISVGGTGAVSSLFGTFQPSLGIQMSFEVTFVQEKSPKSTKIFLRKWEFSYRVDHVSTSKTTNPFLAARFLFGSIYFVRVFLGGISPHICECPIKVCEMGFLDLSKLSVKDRDRIGNSPPSWWRGYLCEA